MNAPELDALQRAIDLHKGQPALAAAISTAERPIKQQHIWNWLNRDKKVPDYAAIPIERATVIDGKPRVTRHELRPDLYPLEEAA